MLCCAIEHNLKIFIEMIRKNINIFQLKNNKNIKFIWGYERPLNRHPKFAAGNIFKFCRLLLEIE